MASITNKLGIAALGAALGVGILTPSAGLAAIITSSVGMFFPDPDAPVDCSNDMNQDLCLDLGYATVEVDTAKLTTPGPTTTLGLSDLENYELFFNSYCNPTECGVDDMGNITGKFIAYVDGKYWETDDNFNNLIADISPQVTTNTQPSAFTFENATGQLFAYNHAFEYNVTNPLFAQPVREVISIDNGTNVFDRVLNRNNGIQVLPSLPTPTEPIDLAQGYYFPVDSPTPVDIPESSAVEGLGVIGLGLLLLRRK